MKETPYEWIARYLAGACSEEEKRQVEEWSRIHPEEMDDLVKIWKYTPVSDFTPDVDQALNQVHRRIDNHTTRRPKQIWMIISSVAAIALILVGLFRILSWNSPLTHSETTLLTLATKSGEKMEQILPDGSKVWLNQSSEIRYPETFNTDLREIYLEGEAFFDIAPDANKPFVIHANQTLTRVVGTSFGVRAIPGETEVVVTVETGIINLSTKGKVEPMVLKQGEQGFCNPELQKLEKNEHPDPNLLAWKTRHLVFNQTPLVEVARVLEEVYQISATVDRSIASLPLTSTFDQLDLEEVLQIIEMTMLVHVQINKDESVNIYPNN